MSKKADVVSIGFLETLLQYYLPGLDTSKLSDDEFVKKTGWLLKIREMEKEESLEKVIKNIFREQ